MRILKTFITISFLLIINNIVFSQTTITLQPGAEDGKDALVHTLGTYSTGEATTFKSNAWTWNSSFGIIRGLLDFDFSSIPEGATITEAKLSLYSPVNSSVTQYHSGENSSVLQRITSTWDENTITWENQPSSTNVNEVVLAEITEEHQDLLDIDVTQLVIDMIDNSGSGFLIKLQTEETYRSMAFSSSDFAEADKHPKLVITYTEPVVQCLIADFPFSENANDISGNNNNGIVYGATLTTDRFGNENSAYYFDGVDDYIEISPVSDLSEMQDFTLSVWFNMEDWEMQPGIVEGELDHPYVFCGHAYSNTVTSDFFRDGMSISCVMNSDETTELRNATANRDFENNITTLLENSDLLLNSWVNNVYVRHGDTLKHYINGQLLSFEIYNDIDFDMFHNLYIGTFAGNNLYYNDLNYNFHGKIDDIKIYQCALTDEEIEDMYTSSSTCVTIQPGAEDGKDALVHSLGIYSTGEATTFKSNAWTWNSSFGIIRGLLDFDFSSIPEGATITEAKLSLYSPVNSSVTQYHSGENSSVLQRITSTWDENTITWENQPNSTEVNEIVLAETTEEHQDLLDIDVTQLVQDMVDNLGYGFLMKLQTEETYRSMAFASSDHAEASKHPKLEVCYTEAINIEPINNNGLILNIYPNPTKDVLFIESLNNIVLAVQVYDINGKLVLNKQINSTSKEINVSSLPNAIYIMNIQVNDTTVIKRFVKCE